MFITGLLCCEVEGTVVGLLAKPLSYFVGDIWAIFQPCLRQHNQVFKAKTWMVSQL